jgi:hypothetical protein
VNHIVAVISQYPFGVFEAFHADRVLAALIELLADLFHDGLDLLGIASAADHEKIREGGNFTQIQNSNVEGFLGFSGSNSGEPQGGGERRCGGLSGRVELLWDTKEFSYPYGTLKFPMRQLLVLLLSFGAWISLSRMPLLAEAPALAAVASPDKGIELAQQQLSRVNDLVQAGALPRLRIQEAEANLEDAKDEVILAHLLYGDLPDKGASEEASAEMIAAARRRVDRQQARLEEVRKMVDAGVAARSYLSPFEAELTARQTSLDLAQLRSHLMADRAAMSRQMPAPAVAQPPLDETELLFQGMEHYEGDGAFTESRDLPPLEWAFANKFDRPLPISAEGETEVHRALGLDHRGRVDVAVVPSQPEGIWLRQYLQLRKIPYYAFSHAIPGKATAAHIHIGTGSTRLASQVTNHLSKRTIARTHSAD